MEEKRLDAAESLELIGRMIRNTRQRLESHSGRPYLVWGYTTVGISLLNYALNRAGADPLWSLSWFLIPILGYALMRLFPERRPTDPRTEIDRIVNALWLVCTLALIPIFLFCIFHGLSYRPSLFALITLTMSIGAAATGLIVRRIRGHGALNALRLLRLLPETAVRDRRDRCGAPQLRDPDLRGDLPRDDGHPGAYDQLPEPTQKVAPCSRS